MCYWLIIADALCSRSFTLLSEILIIRDRVVNHTNSRRAVNLVLIHTAVLVMVMEDLRATAVILTTEFEFLRLEFVICSIIE